MHGEHDRTHGHGLNARPRGRMPYSDSGPRPPDPPRSAGAATLPEATTLPESDGGGQAGAPAPRRPARHRKDEEGDDTVQPPAFRSWTYLDSRPFSMPPPPSPWRRPWSRLSRDQLLGPALVVGFLVAAGVGVWSSGWSPWAGTPTASTVPASPAGHLLADHDRVITPPRAPAVAGMGAKVLAGERKARADRGASRRELERTPAGGSGNGWVKRVERTGRHREGRGSVRTGAGRTGAGPGEAGSAVPVTGDAGRPGGNTGQAVGNPTGSTGNATAGRSRSGARKARSRPRTARTGAPVTGAPSPSVSGGGLPTPDAGAGNAAGISAAYACRHLPSDDWRYAYCVRVWNDYKSRNGLP